MDAFLIVLSFIITIIIFAGTAGIIVGIPVFLLLWVQKRQKNKAIAAANHAEAYKGDDKLLKKTYSKHTTAYWQSNPHVARYYDSLDTLFKRLHVLKELQRARRDATPNATGLVDDEVRYAHLEVQSQRAQTNLLYSLCEQYDRDQTKYPAGPNPTPDTIFPAIGEYLD